MACNPQTLITNAACLECQIPVGMELPVIIYLAAQIAGIPTTQAGIQQMVTGASCIQCNIPVGMQWSVAIYVACQIAGV